MKKIIIISTIIILILVTITGFIYFYMNQGSDISGFPDYYKNLAKECELKLSHDCCMSSVNIMTNGNYQLAPGKTLAESGCPEGYQPNMLKCIDSFRWCEPIKR
ncbi:MAG: hypothetical protein PHT51_02955 [Patescibacteria group bacterium]|nr:hypothetical protein [Patescibacteria group bacterium]